MGEKTGNSADNKDTGGKSARGKSAGGKNAGAESAGARKVGRKDAGAKVSRSRTLAGTGGRTSPLLPARRLAACRQRFEAGEATLPALATELGVSARRLGLIRRQQQWKTPSRRAGGAASGKGPYVTPPAVDSAQKSMERPQLVRRLWAAAGRHMSEIEKALAVAPGDGAAREREAKLMAMLVRVAAGLAALERSVAVGDDAGKGGHGDDAGAGLPDDIDGFRRALAQRIAALRPGGAADEFSE